MVSRRWPAGQGPFTAGTDRAGAVYCYFNNDQQGHAPNNALRLKRMLEKA
jgi:uncharacterized protein YecE (DUF72 family)